MEPVLKMFMFVHIRISKRKILNYDARTCISFAFVFILIALIVNVAFGLTNIVTAIVTLILIMIDLFFVYYWLMSSTFADQYLEKAKDDEILFTRYKMKEF